ncbi:hypothetical protein [Pikeienuella sp. HZG-20]|uniref:hypothetical protein n=1 Tax=Paludibacillus litoralis TaxID=3133267 RepID=UPI0030ECA7EB
MSHPDGYRYAKDIRLSFQLRSLDDATSSDLIKRMKIRKLIDIRKKETNGGIYCIPTTEEAECIISDDQIYEQLYQHFDSSFQIYLRHVSLFLIEPSGSTIPASKLLIEYDTHSRQERYVNINWSFLDDRNLSVNVGPRLNLVESARKIISARRLLGLSSLASKHLENIVNREAFYKSLEKYDGYFLAVKTDSLPDRKTIRKCLGLWDDEIPTGNPKPPLVASKELGAGLRNAYDCYVRAYPQGKDAAGATWHEVVAVVGYSRRHIKRALATFGGQESGRDMGDQS